VSDRYRIARQTPVAVCQKNLAIEPLLVEPDDDLLAVMRRAAAQPATRLVGVVDPDGRLIGMLPILRLAESVVARVVPEAFLGDISDIAGAAQFGHTVEARVVKDAMLPPATVQPTATLVDAFRLMHQRRLSGLYVVDANGRPTGYLDLLELAIVYVEAIEASERETGPDPGDEVEPPRADG
jgi:CBS domain-containing protein